MTETPRTTEERCDDDVLLALPDDDGAARQARDVVRATFTRWGLTVLVDDAELAVSELVTNAVKHGRPPVVLGLRQRAGRVRMDVSDTRPVTTSLEWPVAVSRDSDESGRGRGIVDAVSDHSGTDSSGVGGQGGVRGLGRRSARAVHRLGPRRAVVPAARGRPGG